MGEGGEWTWVDAWILAATPDSPDGGALSRVMATSDAINHAIPTRDELASSLGSLIAAGLVQESDGRFRTTPHGRSIKAHWKGGLFGWAESLRRGRGSARQSRCSTSAEESGAISAAADSSSTGGTSFAMRARRRLHHHSPAPPRIIGTHNHCPMLSPSPRMPR